jgi:DNA-binding Xre family transcriptional regulator
MKKRDLCQIARISPTSMAKLGKGENVNVDILLKICKALGCDISDIMEVIRDAPKDDGGADA